MRDRFDGRSQTQPISGGQVVTPNDSADLQQITRAVHLGVAGDLAVILNDGTALTIPSLEAGWHPIRVTRILATGTTASNIFAGW